jgi:hypothetical protein
VIFQAFAADRTRVPDLLIQASGGIVRHVISQSRHAEHEPGGNEQLQRLRAGLAGVTVRPAQGRDAHDLVLDAILCERHGTGWRH